MECYASQQGLHDYLAAGLGLRAFRTLSLPAGVAGAEGYRRLPADRTSPPAARPSSSATWGACPRSTR